VAITKVAQNLPIYLHDFTLNFTASLAILLCQELNSMFTRNLENPFSSSPTCQSPPLLKSTARHCFCARSLRCCHCCHQRDAAADGRHLLRAKHRPPAPMKPSRLSATPPVHHLISSLRSFLIVATSTSQRSAMVAQPCSTPCDLPWPRAEATPRVQRQAASRYRASR
jgi:hypothetical protein